MQFPEQRLQLWVAVHIIIFSQVTPECLDGGSVLLQNPGQEIVHGLVDPFPALLVQSVLQSHTNSTDNFSNNPWFSIISVHIFGLISYFCRKKLKKKTTYI